MAWTSVSIWPPEVTAAEKWNLALEGVADTICNPGNNGMRATDHVIPDMMLARES